MQKIQVYSRETVGPITRKFLECDMESRYKNVSTIRNVSLIFEHFEKEKFNMWKKIENARESGFS